MTVHYDLVPPKAAKALYNRHLSPGDRLIVVDGAVWARVERYGRSDYRIRVVGTGKYLDGFVRTVDQIRSLVDARMADGTLPAAYADSRRVDIAQREARARDEADRLAALDREAAAWRARAEQAVRAFRQGTELETAILDAMRWARSR